MRRRRFDAWWCLMMLDAWCLTLAWGKLHSRLEEQPLLRLEEGNQLLTPANPYLKSEVLYYNSRPSWKCSSFPRLVKNNMFFALQTLKLASFTDSQVLLRYRYRYPGGMTFGTVPGIQFEISVYFLFLPLLLPTGSVLLFWPFWRASRRFKTYSST